MSQIELGEIEPKASLRRKLSLEVRANTERTS